ncbi:hypothetical protein ACET3Z_026770 [Daucus carota]
MADLEDQLVHARPIARNHGLRLWLRIDATGNSELIEIDKLTMMRRCDLAARDVRLLDPLFVYPSRILQRKNAIVLNMEQIRCIITADEVFLLNPLKSDVLPCVKELRRRLTTAGAGDFLQPEGAELRKRRGSRFSNIFDNSTDLPFEFKAFEVALEAVCTLLDSQTIELEMHIYPLLDELTSRISTSNLDRVRRSKRSLVALTRRVQKVRDEIEQLMDDDGDMAEMYLTEKKSRMESAAFFDDQSMSRSGSNDVTQSASAPISPVSSPPKRRPEKSFSIAKSRHESITSASESVVELEMLLEAYFVDIDSTLNKLKVMKEYIDDTEEFLDFKLDNIRNRLIMFEVLLATAAFIVAVFVFYGTLDLESRSG